VDMEIARSLHCWIFGKHPFGGFISSVHFIVL
jgi:hypothetical protein